MIIKYSEGSIENVYEKENLDEDELDKKLKEALEKDEDLSKEASEKSKPFWIKK